MAKNGMRPVHPGEIIKEEYLVPMKVSVNALAKAMNVRASRINEVVLGERGVTADTALRLALALGGDAESWLNLQTQYDLRVAEIEAGKKLRKEVHRLEAAASGA